MLNYLLFVNTMLCLLKLLLLSLGMDTVNHPRLNNQDFTIKKLFLESKKRSDYCGHK